MVELRGVNTTLTSHADLACKLVSEIPEFLLLMALMCILESLFKQKMFVASFQLLNEPVKGSALLLRLCSPISQNARGQ